MSIKIERTKVVVAFESYTAKYNAQDPKIQLKILHTYRVASLCERIAESLSLSKEECTLAWLCGMLHDVGRFEQIRRYGTFSDADSVDHAIFGADLLFQEDLLKEFLQEGEAQDELPADAIELLELSIRNHSRYRLQEGLSERQAMFCDILRDADKVDIFRVNYDTPLEDIYNVTTEQLRQSPVTEEVKQCFKEKHAVLRALKKAPIDHLVGHICLYFELVYPYSKEATKKQGYLDKLLAFESENEDTRAWFAYMKDAFANEKA